MSGAALRLGTEAGSGGSLPRLGIVDFHPVQYKTPLYQLMSRRARIGLDVLFLTDVGYRPVVDPGFGVPDRKSVV